MERLLPNDAPKPAGNNASHDNVVNRVLAEINLYAGIYAYNPEIQRRMRENVLQLATLNGGLHPDATVDDIVNVTASDYFAILYANLKRNNAPNFNAD